MPKTLKPEEQPSSIPVHPSQISSDKPIEIQKEYGGPKGKEPTRYGDWEKKGRCIDF
jgi:hypothetical protein